MIESATTRPVAIVTGATGGMGERIVARLAPTHDVHAVGRSIDALDQLRSTWGAIPHQLDLTTADAPAALIAGLERLDVLVHAAAISDPLRVDEASRDDWERHLMTNVVAPSEVTRHCLPLLRTSRGSVIFIGSGASTRPVPANAVYTASKHALKGLADVLRIDEEAAGLRVVTVAPGQTATPMLRASHERLGWPWEPSRYIQADSVADVVRFVVDAPSDIQITDIAVRPRKEVR
ncbi:MAG: SDR family oxidoreductase [Rhodoglobus sp.]